MFSMGLCPEKLSAPVPSCHFLSAFSSRGYMGPASEKLPSFMPSQTSLPSHTMLKGNLVRDFVVTLESAPVGSHFVLLF